ncbi:hypothetical protein Q5O89_01420 [Peribacillus frigoritolerans]|nr:hypothetical protein [Peribacillus frigoritolerans]
MFYETLIGLQKFATLLPNNWLAETPQTLESRSLGSQSAERSGFLKSANVLLNKKLQQTSSICFLLFYETLIGLKKFATLLPNNWLAEVPQTLVLMSLGSQSAERERVSEISWNVLSKNFRQSRFSSNLSTVSGRVNSLFFRFWLI